MSEFRFGISYEGAVEKKMDDIGFFIVLILTCIVNAIPLTLFIGYAITSPIQTVDALLTAFWYIWLFISYVSVDKYVETDDVDIMMLIIYFPMITIATIFMRLVLFFIKRKYPNTTDPEEIKRFYRRKKINTII